MKYKKKITHHFLGNMIDSDEYVARPFYKIVDLKQITKNVNMKNYKMYVEKKSTWVQGKVIRKWIFFFK
jgi:hypothetical protein